MLDGSDGISFHAPIHPARPQPGTHVGALPPEVLCVVLVFVVGTDLDLTPLLSLVSVCRAFAACARHALLWQHLAQRMWGPATALGSWPNWRAMALERPRALFHGAFISKVAYVRQGEQNMTQLYRPCALVEYYRYLRLLPGGAAFTLLSSDTPAAVVGRLVDAAAAERAGALLGHWTLAGDVLTVSTVRPATSGPLLLEMALRIGAARSVPSGRLTWISYSYKPLKGGDREYFELTDHHRPFVFSRVRRYAQPPYLPAAELTK